MAEATREQAEFVRRLKGPGARYLVSAPGRLDVMGGITEYTGGLVLHWPIDIGVRVGACRRDDGVVSFWLEPGGEVVDVPLESLRRDAAMPASLQPNAAGGPAAPSDVDVRRQLARAVVVEMLRCQALGPGFNGASLVIGRMPPLSVDVGQVSAAAAAVVVALQRVAGVTVETAQAASVVQSVEFSTGGLPSGRADATHALLAEPGALTQMRCDRPSGADVLRVSERFALIGIACGAAAAGIDTDTGGVGSTPISGAADESDAAAPCDDAHARFARYVHARVAALMGRTLIDRIQQHDARGDNPAARDAAAGWNGHLSLICGREYSQRFRDRLPTRLRGGDFLKRFGPLPDPLSAVSPGVIYRVRSRTEHHIYENARTVQLAERLARAARTGESAVAVDAGKLLYASNWSLSQRCGLNAATADRLVTLLRRRGPAGGILGAKQGGRGCGTLVIALIENTRAAEASVAAACAEFESSDRLPTAVFTASAPGAALGGVSCSR